MQDVLACQTKKRQAAAAAAQSAGALPSHALAWEALRAAHANILHQRARAARGRKRPRSTPPVLIDDDKDSDAPRVLVDDDDSDDGGQAAAAGTWDDMHDAAPPPPLRPRSDSLDGQLYSGIFDEADCAELDAFAASLQFGAFG